MAVLSIAWRFCRVAAKFAREARENERQSREKKLLPPQSPRGLSALARLYYLARPTKTAMLRRLNICTHGSLNLRCNKRKGLPYRYLKLVPTHLIPF